MKTKIIYISGAEIFEINDIRAAFEEVRTALNLDKSTVLFGVPVDAEDAGLSAKETDFIPEIHESKKADVVEEKTKEKTITESEPEIVMETKTSEIRIESVVESEQPKKRGRPRKEEIIEEVTEEIVDENPVETIKEDTKTPDESEEDDEQVVPILSVLSTKTEEIVDDTEMKSDVNIIPEITDEGFDSNDEAENEQTTDMEDIDDDEDADAKLEKLLSAMTPLNEDILESEDVKTESESDPMDTSVDATLEQLATEFIENQDKIAAETKSTSRSKIGKLRNILPFKQSKHKETNGLGDLFGWAGIAANDEDFSVPGFFTSAASKK